MSVPAFVAYVCTVFGFFVGAFAAVRGYLALSIFCAALMIGGPLLIFAEARFGRFWWRS